VEQDKSLSFLQEIKAESSKIPEEVELVGSKQKTSQSVAKTEKEQKPIPPLIQEINPETRMTSMTQAYVTEKKDTEIKADEIFQDKNENSNSTNQKKDTSFSDDKIIETVSTSRLNNTNNPPTTSSSNTHTTNMSTTNKKTDDCLLAFESSRPSSNFVPRQEKVSKVLIEELGDGNNHADNVTKAAPSQEIETNVQQEKEDKISSR